MASTNKTTNYELSQYLGSDKPTYLGDYNSDMLKIDNAIHQNALNIATADEKATLAVFVRLSIIYHMVNDRVK